eukprot:TRINITY_DN8744_c0_g3_i1.p1 TRINITY_DN8744_c0_g3~~TRINITY_DN8744_c0_g3_i1.p1  ORF type:complete len:429 (+),score=75.41 TRINITY_DN8744_c0_g3_i1:39-1325(+)
MSTNNGLNPRWIHVGLAYVIGAMLTKLLMVKEVNTVDAVKECGEVQQDQYGEKEMPVGQGLELRAGSLKGIIDKAENGTVILTFANSKYIDSMVNWVAQVEKLGITNYAIVCLDTGLAKWFAQHKSRCAYILTGWKQGAWSTGGENNCTSPGQQPTIDSSLPACKQACEQDQDCKAITWNKGTRTCYKCSGSYNVRANSASEIHLKRTTDTIWFARWKLLLRLLNKNVHVLMSDLDALFVRNPMPVLQEYEKTADIVSQRGSFPEVQSSKWGAALCMGFSYWRATKATQRFTSSVNQMIETSGDDQIGVNQALDIADVRWEGVTDAGLKMEFEKARVPNFGETNKGLRVALLPHHTFPRKCDEYSETNMLTHSFVSHCFEPAKQGGAKMKLAQKYNLWVVKEDWETVDVNTVSSFSEYIQQVRVEDRA